MKKFVVRKVKQVKAIKATFKAGMIAHNCEACVVDDENEEIRACLYHNAEIGRLSKISLDNWGE